MEFPFNYYMTIIEMIFLGIGLAMDAAAVAMTNGLVHKEIQKKKAIIIALFFGIFQGVMPLIGFFLGNIALDFITQFTAWLALFLLGFIGGKMLFDAIFEHDDDEKEDKSLTIKSLIVQAFATSIDALTVGVLFVSADSSKATSNALIASLIIAVVTFAISYVSVFIGKKFGLLFSKKAQIAGGLILIGIGLKTFIEYLIQR